MDARPGSGEAAGAATAEAAVQQPVAYPHLWFDDRGRPWIDEKNSVRLASALSASAAQAAHAPLAFVRDHVGDGQNEECTEADCPRAKTEERAHECCYELSPSLPRHIVPACASDGDQPGDHYHWRGKETVHEEIDPHPRE